jgi:crotonobetainyl-CoA:carnitine CoA-transferase CaiB-like acyl-CoA transferase
MLKPYRVLDLTEGDAALGPMILADLGAEVIRVEPPGGCNSRYAGYLHAAAPKGLASPAFHAYNRGKKSFLADITTETGREALRGLARGADFLFESAPPGAMDAMGLGFDALSALNPRLVYVATTPFGQEGPYAKHRSTDLTLAAMGGMMALNGDPDRPPVRITVPQTWRHAAAESAAAALVAHHLRLQTGAGQFVDVSVQASVFWTGLNAMIAAAITGSDIERAGTTLQLGTLDLPLCFPVLDGYVVMVPTGATMVRLVDRMIADGAVPEVWRNGEDWPTYDLRFLTGRPVSVRVEEMVEGVRAWTSRWTKGDLLEWGLQNNVTLAPVSSLADVLSFGHLHERKYWRAYTIPGGPAIHLPGAFVRPHGSPLAVPGPAPAAGADTAALMGQSRVAAPVAAGGGALPFSGLKVADFSWIGVGPITAKYFADHGAEVVRIEAVNPVDRLRGAGPHKDGIQATNRSQFFASFNTSKKGIVLDLKQPAAKAVAERLLRWCDIAFESFTPGTMADLGLGYERAKALNPDIIMVSTCLMGQTGPAARLAGYGYHAAAISGFDEVVGWADRAPAGPFNAYTDVIAPHFLSATVMAALDHHRRTGEGQHIEQAQMESALHFLAPELVRYQLDGTLPFRAGNEDPDMAPHGAYPVAGADQWIAIAIETDEQWAAFVKVMGSPDWATAPGLETTAGRLTARADLDERIGAWTWDKDRYRLMDRLQYAGIPAGVVQRSSDLLRDPQLAHRHFFRPMVHGEMGEVPYEGHMFRIRGYDNGPRFPAPLLGEHTYEVLTEVLGMSDDEAAEALASGGVGT